MTDKATAKQVYEAVQEAMSTNLKQVAVHRGFPVVIKSSLRQERLKRNCTTPNGHRHLSTKRIEKAALASRPS